jgi:hypothetical protein
MANIEQEGLDVVADPVVRALSFELDVQEKLLRRRGGAVRDLEVRFRERDDWV